MALREWKPSGNDATSLAAFRWFANTIENEAMELYATDRERFKEIEEIRRGTLRELAAMRVKAAIPNDENGCPDGWVLRNGICAPSCDLIGEVAKKP